MPAVYCTADDITNRLSEAGVTYRVDDDPPDSLGDVIDDASGQIDEAALLRYGANLVHSRWVKHRCADIAAYLLCERRGNPVPPGIARKYQRAEEQLDKVQANRLSIGDIAEQRANVPVMSNVSTFMSRTGPKTVVEPSRSSTIVLPTDYAQSIDPLDGFDFQI